MIRAAGVRSVNPTTGSGSTGKITSKHSRTCCTRPALGLHRGSLFPRITNGSEIWRYPRSLCARSKIWTLNYPKPQWTLPAFVAGITPPQLRLYILSVQECQWKPRELAEPGNRRRGLQPDVMARITNEPGPRGALSVATASSAVSG